MTYDELRKTLLPKFCTYLTDNHRLKFSTSGVLSIDSERITLKEFPTWFLSYCKEDNTKEYMELLTATPSTSNLFESVKTEIRMIQSRVKNSVYKGADVAVKGFSYEGLIPFRSVTNSKHVVFFSKDLKQVTDLDYEAYAADLDKEFRIRPMPAIINFNPYRPEQLYMEKSKYGQECTHINTYSKPEWQIGKKLTEAESKHYAKLPKLIDEFFDHLFPNKHCKEFIYDWLHFALVSRCETYLVLNGAKGIGKNILSEVIGKALIGKSNHKLAQRSALDGNFNALLVECRMIVFDEFKMTDDITINALKRYINTDQMIERKSIDVGKTEETFNSFFIQNNALTDMRVEWDDRRFSVADLTEKKLAEVWSQDKIDLLLSEVNDVEGEFMRNFGYWLMYRVPVVMDNNFYAYKGNHFYKLCYTSYPEWAKMIIDEITSGHPKTFYEEGDLRMMFGERTNKQQRFPNISKVTDFLKNYKHNGEFSLGHIEKDERSNYLQVNPHFVKTANDTTGMNFTSTDLL